MGLGFRRRLLQGCVFLFISAPILLAAENAEHVEDLAEPGRIEFEGARQVGADTLRRVLRGFPDPGYLAASCPLAPRADFISCLRRILRAGYRNSGFRDAEVEAVYDAEARKIRVRISEGSRYRAGPVRVLGLKSIPKDEFVHLLKTPPPGKKEEDAAEPLWAEGQFLSFEPQAQEARREAVKRAFAARGFFFPAFDVAIGTPAEGQAAELTITVRDEGPAGVLGAIEVAGIKKNTAAEVLAYLDLRKGAPFDASILARVEKKLFESARFLKYEVSVVPPEGPEQPISLRINLREFEKAPPLGQAFSETEAAFLKLCEGMSRLNFGDRDVCIAARITEMFKDLPVEFRARFAPAKGIVATAVDTQVPEDAKAVFGLVGSATGLVFLEPTRNQRVQSSGMTFGIMLTLELIPDPDQDEMEDDNPFAFNFGLGFKEAAEGKSAEPFKLELKMAPVAFVGLAHKKEISHETKDGVFTLRAGSFEMALDLKSGEVVNAVLKDTGDGVRLDLQPSKFDAEAKRLLATVPEPADKAAGGLMGLVAHLVSNVFFEDDELSPQQNRGRRVLAELAGSALDDAWNVLGGNHRAAEEDETFKIPGAESNDSKTTVGQFLMVYADACFPRRTWAWTLARGLGSVLAKNQAASGYLLEDLDFAMTSETTGPLGELALAAFFNQFGLPQPAMAIRLGQERLGSAGFRHDAELLLTGKTELGRTFLGALEGMRDWPPEKAADVASLLPVAARPEFERCVERLHKDKALPIRDELLKVLDACWDAEWKDWVRKRLEAVGKTEPARDEPNF